MRTDYTDLLFNIISELDQALSHTDDFRTLHIFEAGTIVGSTRRKCRQEWLKGNNHMKGCQDLDSHLHSIKLHLASALSVGSPQDRHTRLLDAKRICEEAREAVVNWGVKS